MGKTERTSAARGPRGDTAESLFFSHITLLPTGQHPWGAHLIHWTEHFPFPERTMSSAALLSSLAACEFPSSFLALAQLQCRLPVATGGHPTRATGMCFVSLGAPDACPWEHSASSTSPRTGMGTILSIASSPAQSPEQVSTMRARWKLMDTK